MDRLRQLAQERYAQRIEIHQLTDHSHEMLVEPGRGTLSVGKRRAEELVDVEVVENRVELVCPWGKGLIGALAAALQDLGGAE